MRLTFGINVHDETAETLVACLSSLREHDPEASVFVVGDGVDNSWLRSVCYTYAADFHPGVRLKLVKYGAEWWDRFMRLAVSYDPDFVFKVDPDTRFHRPFKVFPAYAVFGSVERDYDVQGGIQGFRVDAVKLMLNAGVFRDPLYTNLKAWAEPRTISYEQAAGGQMSSDHTLAHIVKRLGLSWGDWPEVDSQWRKTRPFRDGVAATHPHK